MRLRAHFYFLKFFLTLFQSLDRMLFNMKKKPIEFVVDGESISIYKESLINTLKELLAKDMESSLTVQSVIFKLENGDL